MCAECRFAVSYSTCATAIVIPRSRSSGALSIDPKSRTATFLSFVCSTFVIADVSVVLPWSFWPAAPSPPPPPPGRPPPPPTPPPRPLLLLGGQPLGARARPVRLGVIGHIDHGK